MGDLTNLQISQTFDGLIKTNNEQPIDGTLKGLQDGVGNNLPVEVSTTGVNFTGTVTGIDTGVQSVVAGTNVTVDNTDPANPIVSASGGGGGGGLYNTVYMPRFHPTGYNNYGYQTNFMTSQPINGDVQWSNLIDGGDSTAVFSHFYARPDTSVTEIAFAVSNMTANQDYTVVFYDSYTNGMPKDLLQSNVIPVTNGTDRWITHTLATPLQIVAGEEYWFGIKTNYGTGNIRNTVGRQAVSRSVGTIIDLNNPNEGFLGNNSMYFNGTLPSTFTNGQGFGTRDEAVILLYR